MADATVSSSVGNAYAKFLAEHPSGTSAPPVVKGESSTPDQDCFHEASNTHVRISGADFKKAVHFGGPAPAVKNCKPV